MLQRTKRSIVSVLKNIPGKSLGRQIVVIECDDWGSIRMPSKQTFELLQRAGVPVNNSRYNRNDTLVTAADLEALFAVLNRYQDRHGNPTVMSPFCNTANPDFEKIRACGFTRYYRESFVDTYKRYGREAHILDVWKQGIAERVFAPEFHGREHIATNLWLKFLRSGDKPLLTAFDHGFASYSPASVPAAAREFRPTFYIEEPDSLKELEESIEDGIQLFEDAFGFAPQVFNAPNGVFVSEFNEILLKKGIKFNAVPKQRRDRMKDGTYKPTTFSTGRRSPEGLIYYVRNCNFEPTEKSYRSVQHVLDQIGAAFLCGKAAVIGTHRVNFVGGINEDNRKRGLSELDTLLKAIVARWPRVEFMSSRDFASLL